MKVFKTTPEGEEYIRLVLNHSESNRLFELLESIKMNVVSDFISYNVVAGTDRELSLKKAQIDGINRLIRDLRMVKTTLN